MSCAEAAIYSYLFLFLPMIIYPVLDLNPMLITSLVVQIDRVFYVSVVTNNLISIEAGIYCDICCNVIVSQYGMVVCHLQTVSC